MTKKIKDLKDSFKIFITWLIIAPERKREQKKGTSKINSSRKFPKLKDIFQILKGELSTQCHEQHTCTLSLSKTDSCEIWNTDEKDHFKNGALGRPRGWDGEGGRRGDREGEHTCKSMADSCQCMAKTTTIL